MRALFGFLARVVRELRCALGQHEHEGAYAFGNAPLYPVECDWCAELFYAPRIPKHRRPRD